MGNTEAGRGGKRTLRAAVKELLSHLDIEDCDGCGGTGLSPVCRSDACICCGGYGEEVKGVILPEEVRALRSAVAEGD